jgi:SAM-dependent methyltransferase
MEVLYVHTEMVHNFKAANEVLPLVISTFKPNSILDVGCGIGTWLKVAKELGVKKVIGVDGDYVKRELLKIDETEFICKDLRNSFSLNSKFDIAICLEVVEHLPVNSARQIISSLCLHSDIVIFSAAIPNQGGQNHINEQWPSYWVDIFAKYDYRPYDILRPVFWNNENIDFWYRQNMIVFSKKNIVEYFPIPKINILNSYIHPILFEKKVAEIKYLHTKMDNERINPGVKNSFFLLLKALFKKLFKN